MEEKRSWFSRNWMWVVPTGGCLLLLIFGIFLFGSLIFGVTKMMENSEPYAHAFEQAISNEVLIDHIGDPIVGDGMVQGSMNYDNGMSTIDIIVPIKGPNGKASIHIKGEKTAEQWDYERLIAVLKETSDTINLLEIRLDSIQ